MLRLRPGILAATAALLCAAPALADSTDSDRAAVEAPLPSPGVTFAGERPAAPPVREHWSLGAFGGVGFPRPLSVGGMLRIERIAGFGAEYSFLPRMSIAGVDSTIWALAATARVFPFRGAFFLGIGGGHQHVALDASTPLGAAAQVADTWFVNPQIGFLKAFPSGVTVGIDAGVQIPVNATYTSNVPAVVAATSSVFDIAHTVGTSALPTVDLFRLGLTI